MDTRLLVTTTLAASLTTSFATAEATRHQVSSFAELAQHVNDLGDLTSTLVVMDDDDTLTMMPCPKGSKPKNCQYLGGPAWYAWQENLLTDNPDSPYLVAKDEATLLKLSTMLFAINNMVYTEADVPKVLNNLSSKGVRLLVETARGYETTSATAAQFSALTAATGSYSQLISRNSLIMEDSNTTSLPGPYTPCNIPGSRSVNYQQGVIYVAGQNKGTMLQCLLQSYENSESDNPALPIRNIVFIDDTQKNVDDIYQTFAGQQRYQVRALHYNAFDAHKAALTTGPNAKTYQDNAKRRWEKISQVLHHQLQSTIATDPNAEKLQRVSQQ